MNLNLRRVDQRLPMSELFGKVSDMKQAVSPDPVPPSEWKGLGKRSLAIVEFSF